MDGWLKLENEFGPSLQQNVPLSGLTTTGIGGPAKYFYDAKTQADLVHILKFAAAHQLPFLVIGGGSNLLVNDSGVDVLVIKNSVSGVILNGSPVILKRQAKDLEILQQSPHNNQVVVQAGTPLQALVDFSLEHGLAGLHKLTGIPGTVGGAVYGNAGAFGQTISDHITQVTIFDGQTIKTLSKTDCGFNYRHSNFKLPLSSWQALPDQAPILEPLVLQNDRAIILEITLELPTSDPRSLKSKSQEVLSKRAQKYPPGIKCPGSFFKNLLAENLPPTILNSIPNLKDYYGKVPSWYFLEQVGAKGDRQGGVEIANFHANLFMNTNHGTAQDYWDLAHKYAQKVHQKFGITLEPEVQLVNLPPL